MQVDELTKNLNRMNDVREKIKKHVEQYQKYQSYLERVVIEAGEFNSIAEIFNRYETLIEARILLSEHQDKNLELLEERGTEIVNALNHTFYSFSIFNCTVCKRYISFFAASYDGVKDAQVDGVE